MKEYTITYWGRRGDEGYDWITVGVYGDSEEDALENLKKRDSSFKPPYETFKRLKNDSNDRF